MLFCWVNLMKAFNVTSCFISIGTILLSWCVSFPYNHNSNLTILPYTVRVYTAPCRPAWYIFYMYTVHITGTQIVNDLQKSSIRTFIYVYSTLYEWLHDIRLSFHHVGRIWLCFVDSQLTCVDSSSISIIL